MNGASQAPNHRNASFLDRFQSWIAGSASAVLHLLFLLIVLHAAKTKLAPPPQGGTLGGARVKVEFIGQPPQGKQGPVTPIADDAEADRLRPAATPERPLPVQATRVVKADSAMPPRQDRPKPSDPAEAAGSQRRVQPPTGDPNARRSNLPAGQAPGLLDRETAPDNIGPDRGLTQSPVRGPPAPGREPRMDVDGHQIYYDVRNENRLLDWQAQGMTELSFPLPGRRDYMVCPLEIVVRRGSGGCRLVAQGDPELARIGDARDVVTVVRVYRRGELIWSGPGAYR